MRVSELSSAIDRLGEVSARHGATQEAEALNALTRLMEAHASKSVAEFVKLALSKGKKSSRSRRR